MRFISRLFPLFIMVLALAACAPAAPIPTLMAPAATVNPTAVEAVATVTPPAAETVAPAPAGVATSRGDKLEASDPATVKVGLGRPVLVEFFRFT